MIQQYFDEISHDTGKYCFGVDDTLRGLEMGAVETLIVWENLDVTRHYLRDSTGAEHIVHVHAPPPAANTSKAVSAADNAASGGINALSEQDREKFIDKQTGLEMEQSKESQPLLEWLAENYTSMGAQLEFITNKSQEGSQWVSSFLFPSFAASESALLYLSLCTAHVGSLRGSAVLAVSVDTRSTLEN